MYVISIILSILSSSALILKENYLITMYPSSLMSGCLAILLRTCTHPPRGCHGCHPAPAADTIALDATLPPLNLLHFFASQITAWDWILMRPQVKTEDFSSFLITNRFIFKRQKTINIVLLLQVQRRMVEIFSIHQSELSSLKRELHMNRSAVFTISKQMSRIRCTQKIG
jgi:hypothetical protein